MRAFYVDKKMLARDSQIRQHPNWRSQAGFLAEFITQLRAAAEPTDYFGLHQDLLERYLGTQRGIGDHRAKHAEARLALKDAVLKRDRARVSELSQQIDVIRWSEEAASAMLSVYRSLADAMVWHCVGFDRAAITCVGEGRRVGWLADWGGLEGELSELHMLWMEHGIFSVLADMTNCVRCCDLLSVEQWEPRVVRITESKTGAARGARSRRQRERLAQLTTLINDGYHASAAPDGGPLTMVTCPTPATTNLAAIDELLQRAKRTTYAAEEVERGVFVEAFDERDPGGIKPVDLGARHDESLTSLGWDKTDCLPYGVQFRRFRDHRQGTFSSQLPLALLPFDANDVALLLLGDLDYVTTANAALLESRLTHDGRTVTVARESAAGDCFLEVERGLQHFVVPAPTREMLLIEGLSIRDLDAQIAWNLDSGARQQLSKRTMAVSFASDLQVFGP